MHTYTVYYVTYETRGIAYESQSFIENLASARRYSEQLARIGAQCKHRKQNRTHMEENQ